MMVDERSHAEHRGAIRPPTARAIGAPPRHEGVSRALKGSFGSVAALPEDFVRLLDRLH